MHQGETRRAGAARRRGESRRRLRLPFQDGETPLIKATKMRSIEIVELLLDKGAKVSAVDKVGQTRTTSVHRSFWSLRASVCERSLAPFEFPQRGDTPLHIAIRGRSRRLAELLLRNPKDGRLLYRPNKAGETPYNIDCSHQKSILTQIFGARTCPTGPSTRSPARPLTGRRSLPPQVTCRPPSRTATCWATTCTARPSPTS